MRLGHAIHCRRCFVRARVGLDDPADTGRLWGIIGPLTSALYRSRLDVEVSPVFHGPELAFQGAAEVRVVPLQLLGTLLSFGLSPATWRVVRPALRP